MDGLLIGENGILLYKVGSFCENGVFTDCFGIIQAFFSQLRRILIAGNAVKQFCSPSEIVFRLPGSHGSCCSFILLLQYCRLQCFLQPVITKPNGLLEIGAGMERLGAILQCLLLCDLHFRHQLAQIGLSALGIQIQHLFAIFVGTAPVPVLQEHEGTLQQRCNIGSRGGIVHHHGFFHDLRLFVRIQHLGYTTDQVLNKADLRHVIGLQHGQLLRQIIRIHAPVAGQQQLVVILLHHGQEPAPLVFHPNGVQVFRLGAHHDHHLGAVQGRKNVGLILGAGNVVHGNTGIEYPSALLFQVIIKILGQSRIVGAYTLIVLLLIADKNIIGLRIPGRGQDAPLNLGNLGSVFLILAPGDAVGMFHRCQIVHIFQETVERSPVAGRHPLKGGGIFHILNAEPAKSAAPVGFGVIIVLLDDPLIHRQGLVKFANAAEMVAPVKGRRPLLVIDLGESHGAAAMLAHTNRAIIQQFHIAAAHFALQNSHLSLSYVLFYIILHKTS